MSDFHCLGKITQVAAEEYRSWGLNPKVKQQAYVVQGNFSRDQVSTSSMQSWLPFGCGSSYGDVCLNDEGLLLDTQKLDRFLGFNKQSGVLRCQSGVTLRSINHMFVKRGWFLPVTPGTQNVTIGGAIANDVHGKNHHQAGSFGCHIRRLGLYRSEEGNIECAPDENHELFNATIAGLGLTGFIQWADIQLKAVPGPYLKTEKMVFRSLQEFSDLASNADRDYEYTVAWIDSVASTRQIGRGVFFCGNHASVSTGKIPYEKKKLVVPCNAPAGLLSYPAVKLFNKLYFTAHQLTPKMSQVFYEPFFYPLDSISHWNRLYGKQGFYQYQCVVPVENGVDLVRELLMICSHYANGSFLSVLKKFGDIKSPGMLSFPRPGYTLALDFRNLGKSTHEMFAELDKIVFANHGALYPAKDARMSREGFRQSFPDHETFLKYIDPMFSSNFLNRVIRGDVH